MIWKFHFSRRTLVWILGISLILGLGIRGAESLRNQSLAPTGRVTNTPEALRMKQLADSIMAAREARLSAPLNINTATASELDRLDGIGKVLSTRIVEYRTVNGPFKSVDDLENVSGIGPKKLAVIRDKCVVDSPSDSLIAVAEEF